MHVPIQLYIENTLYHIMSMPSISLDQTKKQAFPVSPWTLRAPDQLRTSALRAPFCVAGAPWEDLYLVKNLVCARKGIYSTDDVFQMRFF
jgi:hypothetical protein